jgi:hypothetical protein
MVGKDDIQHLKPYLLQRSAGKRLSFSVKAAEEAV